MDDRSGTEYKQRSYPDLIDCCAVVVGAAGGIGKAVADALALSGCRLALLDLPLKGAESQAYCEVLRARGTRALSVATDTLSQSDLDHAFAQAEHALGPVRILVNCAGRVVRKPALDLQEEDWDAVMDSCAKGTFLACLAAARTMRQHGGGSIVNIGSIFGIVGGQNRAAYAASKAAVAGLSRVLALEWSTYGIRVNVVAPAFARTPMTQGLLSQGLDVTDKALLAPLIEPADVAAATLFLASDAASRMITGQVLAVDAGWTIW